MVIKKEEFCSWIETVRFAQGISYIDAVLDACENFNVRIEMVKDLLNVQITSKIEAEAKDLNFIKKTDISLKKFL